uniref:(northern house mosquito) hypothetical protein n=1 Tax=Culex pipiens TaxID=7175 RepID=A0A8D8AX00_CULPI
MPVAMHVCNLLPFMQPFQLLKYELSFPAYTTHQNPVLIETPLIIHCPHRSLSLVLFLYLSRFVQPPAVLVVLGGKRCRTGDTELPLGPLQVLGGLQGGQGRPVWPGGAHGHRLQLGVSHTLNI